MIGKFSSEEELLKGYENLEKEFTKKCQELSLLKKEQEAQKSQSEDLASLDNLCERKEGEEEKLEEANLPLDKSSCQDDFASAIQKEENLQNKEASFNRVQALELLLSRPDAKEYSREIAKELIVNKSLKNADNPFFMAYLIVKDRMGGCEKQTEKSIKNEEKHQKTETKLKETEENSKKTEDVFPSLLLGTKGDGIGVPYRKKYSSLEDARADLINRYFS